MKKQSAGFVLNVVSVAAAVVGLIGYLVNCGTNYFSNIGVDSTIVTCVVAAVLVQAVYVIVNMKGTKIWADVLAVAVPVLLMVGMLLLVGSRVNSIAAVMTYENNASNMADLMSCIVGIAGLLVATVVSVVASFHDVTKA